MLAGGEAGEPRTLTAALFFALADREPAPSAALPIGGDLSPEWARKLSAPFVLDPTYGTRCSTVLTIGHDGALLMTERRFDANGDPVANLDLIRSIFFAKPGRSLGRHHMQVRSQAQHYDHHHPTDSDYVEIEVQ